MRDKECPSCGEVINATCSRLIKDSCGHAKCRMCLMYEEQGCKICANEHRIQNIGNYDFPTSEKERANDSSELNKNSTRKEILPLELVINKDSKVKENFVPITTEYINNYELYSDETVDKTKGIYKSATEIEENNISNKSYVSNIESKDVCSNVLNNDPSENGSLEIKKEFSKNGLSIKNKPPICADRNHITIIPGTPEKYKCNICNKIFRNKKGKCYHDACVTGVKPYQCSFCDKSFIKRSHFEYHERVHRGYKPFKCDLCEKAFPQRNKLNRHMYSHSSEKQFVCFKCDKRYTMRDDLKNHLSLHNDTSTYTCKTCNKTFRILSNLKRHLKTHANERPYICDQCTKSFKEKSLLIRHKKTHGKDRPFSCAHCSRVFLSKSELRRHLMVHSDEKPFNCKYCETVFRRKDNLHRHIRHHHPESSSFGIKDAQITTPETSMKSTKTKQINSKQKQKTKKTQKVPYNLLTKTPTKMSVVYLNSCDRIGSRLDSMGNVTSVIKTTNEVSNAVSVINGPIHFQNPEDKSNSKRKTFTYTEPIPPAEAVVINKRIEEKLYPQNISNHNYFLRNCLNCTDKSYSTLVNQSSNTNFDSRYIKRKVIPHGNSSLSESILTMQMNFTSRTTNF